MSARRTLAVSIALLVSSGAACGHEVESPDPSLVAPPSAVQPDLVCNARPVDRTTSRVVVRGAGMTPMPTKTLTDGRTLVLPQISLELATPIAGATAAGPIVLTDDPSPTGKHRVSWASEQEMAFEVAEEDALPTGVMTVVVTNPDGKKSARVDKSLAILPRPVIAKVAPKAICDDQADQTVVIEGTSFLAFDDKAPTVKVGDKTYPATVDDKSCAAVEGAFAEKNVRLCTALSIKIGKGDFPVTVETKVPVVVTNPAPANCATSETITLTIEPPPRVDSVVPSTVCEGGSQLTISGAGFIAGAKVRMECAGKTLDASTATVTADGKQIAATFGGGATPGEKCDVVVQNPDGCEDRPLPHKQVTVVSGPILFYADPPIVWNGTNMQVTLFATTIARPLPADGAVTLRAVPAGTETKLTPKDVPGYANRVQITVPAGQAAGDYDVTLKDASGCFATLPKGVKVVSETTVTLKSVLPPFGWTGEDTSVTVLRDTAAVAPKNKPFVDSPRMFLSPSSAAATDVAVPLTGVSFLDGDRVTAVVPKGTAAKKYDLVLLNPDGTVGVLAKAFDELTSAPPVIDAATPSSIVAATGQTVVVAGKNFDAAAAFSLRCVDAAGAAATAAVTGKSGVTATSATLTVDASALSAGAVCVLRVTNPDGAWGEYSAIGVTNASLNLSAPKAGSPLVIGRRALSAAAADASAAQRFVYALGGDGGTAATALDSYELAPVDVFGKVGAFAVGPNKLGAKRTLSGSVTLGRYVYLVGGDDGAGPVATTERALVLSPRETPEITDVDLALGAAGLEPGTYHYRVSATFLASDSDNPGGESLASDEFTIRVPAFATKKVAVTLVFRKPVDKLGADLPNVAGYRVYRSAKDGASGSETLLGAVTGAATLTFTDDGSKTLGTEKPLPLGALGAFAKLPNLGTKRAALSVASAADPVDPTKVYVYALLGRSDATTPVGTHEMLAVTIAPNGRQSFAASWTAGAITNAAPRSEAGAWVVTSGTSSVVPAGETWIYVGGGRGAGGLSGAVDAAKVGAGGALGAWDVTPKDFSSDSAGYGVCAANGQLFLFGGAGGAPSSGAKSATLVAPVPTLKSNSWNAEGLTMTQPRVLMGSAVQSAFIFLVGGQTATDAASKTLETVIW